LVLVLIISLSNSARAAKRWKVNFPDGVVVSISSCRLLKPTPILSNLETRFTKSRRLLPRRSSFQKGELYYPIDVKIKEGKIYVADAYNNRVQVFDINGKILKVIGIEDGFNVASGIAFTKEDFAVTDQENSRVLIYNLNGELQQILSDNINYPTSVLPLSFPFWPSIRISP
jgi:DNA-binding beta-propeller fold protein YncE